MRTRRQYLGRVDREVGWWGWGSGKCFNSQLSGWKCLICSICQFPWCKCSYDGQLSHKGQFLAPFQGSLSNGEGRQCMPWVVWMSVCPQAVVGQREVGVARGQAHWGSHNRKTSKIAIHLFSWIKAECQCSLCHSLAMTCVLISFSFFSHVKCWESQWLTYSDACCDMILYTVKYCVWKFQG